MEGQETKNADGLNRAALLMMTLDKPVLARVLKHLSPPELSRLVRAHDRLSKSGPPASAQLLEVGNSFLASGPAAASNNFKDALAIAFGEDGADQILRQDQWRTIADRVKPEALANVLRGERPEAVAITLSQLPPRFAADVLGRLPEDLRVAAIESLSRAETAPPGGQEAILRAVENSISASAVTEDLDRKTSAKRAAAVLNQLDPESASEIIERIRGGDSEGAALIEGEMFQFRDFLKLDNRALQSVLSEVPAEKLAKAVKGITDEERAIIFAALPEQVRTMVEGEIADSGPVPVREVKASRREITDLAIQMERQGKIRLRAEEEAMA
jgi:flagellar motor switch protein FliG